MNYSKAKGQLVKLSERLNYTWVMSLGLLGSNVLLSGLAWYALLHQEHIVTPFNAPVSYIASSSTVDASYLDLMTMNLLNLRFNVSPATVDDANQRLLSHIAPRAYATFLKQLNEEAKLIKKDKLSSTFHQGLIHSDPKKLITVVSGSLEEWVGYNALTASTSSGVRPLKSEQQTYVFQYEYTAGQLWLKSLQEFSHDKK